MINFRRRQRGNGTGYNVPIYSGESRLPMPIDRQPLYLSKEPAIGESENPERRVIEALASADMSLGQAVDGMYTTKTRLNEVMIDRDIHGLEARELSDIADRVTQLILRSQGQLEGVNSYEMSRKGISMHKLTKYLARAEDEFEHFVEKLEKALEKHPRGFISLSDRGNGHMDADIEALDARLEAVNGDLEKAHAAIQYVADGGEDEVSISRPEIEGDL